MTTTGEPSIFLSLAEILANTQADELEVKQKLHQPRIKYVEEKTASITQELEKNYSKLLKHMDAISIILKEELELLSHVEKDLYAKELSIALEKLTDIEKIQRNKDDTWQHLLGLSDRTLLWIYKLGYDHYEQKKFEEAHSFFQLLVVFNSLVSDYWIALGFSERSLSLNEKALNSFNMATLLNPENPIPRYQAAELHLHLGNFENALIELDNLTKLTPKEEKGSLYSDIELLRSKIKNRQ